MVQTIQRNADGDLVVHVVTGRNTIVATSTQPTFLGSYADPRFSLDFALTFDFVIDIPPVTAPVGGSRVVELRIIAPHLDSQNFAGDVLLVVGKIITFLAGTDVDSLLDAQIRANLGADSRSMPRWPPSTRCCSSTSTPATATSRCWPATRPRCAANSVPRPGSTAYRTGRRAWCCCAASPTNPASSRARSPGPTVPAGPVDPKTFVIANSMAKAFVPEVALAGLRDLMESPAPPLVAAQVVGEELRLGQALVSFAQQPAAAAAAQASLVDGGVRLWDAAQQPEPEALQIAQPPAAAPQLRAALSAEVYAAMLENFRLGPLQFVVRCMAADPAGSHETGHMTAMWYEDSDGWQRRRYRIEGVETGRPLSVSCALAPQWHWLPGSIEQIAPRNWSGSVTVHKARALGDLIRDGQLQMTVSLKDGSHRTVPVGVLETAGAVQPSNGERAIIVVGGVPGDEAALNPQPLPPKWREQLLDLQGDAQAMLVAPGDAAGLNPQPLPPKWRGQLQGALGGLGGHAALNPQPLPPKVALGLRGPGTFLKRFGVTPNPAPAPAVAAAASPAATAIEAHVDTFGDLVTKIDPDVLIPDTVDPVGYGTVRGVDFRVWPKE